MLTSGTWTGTLGAGRGARTATATIERCATGFKIDFAADGRMGSTETATYRRGRLAFELPRYRRPGTMLPRTFACVLNVELAGDLVGACTAGGETVPLRLAPPADGQLGCD